MTRTCSISSGSGGARPLGSDRFAKAATIVSLCSASSLASDFWENSWLSRICCSRRGFTASSTANCPSTYARVRMQERQQGAAGRLSQVGKLLHVRQPQAWMEAARSRAGGAGGAPGGAAPVHASRGVSVEQSSQVQGAKKRDLQPLGEPREQAIYGFLVQSDDVALGHGDADDRHGALVAHYHAADLLEEDVIEQRRRRVACRTRRFRWRISARAADAHVPQGQASPCPDPAPTAHASPSAHPDSSALPEPTQGGRRMAAPLPALPRHKHVIS